PDGRWLATRTGGHGTQLWEAGTWRPGHQFASRFSWSADGQLLAIHEVSVIRWVDPDSGREVFRVTGPEAKWYFAAHLTPDKTSLIATISDNSAIYVWNLRLIREQLKELGMDWDLPEFPPLADVEVPRAPLAVTIEAGILRKPAFESDQDAVAAYSLMLALQPINPEAYLERGLAYGRLKQAAKAVADYDMFLALASKADCRRPEILMRRANNYHETLRDFRGAVAAITPLTEVASDLIPWPDQCA